MLPEKQIKKVRIILGPNGSGKSTIKQLLSEKNSIDFGFFINADDLQRQLNQDGRIKNTLQILKNEAVAFLKSHSINNIFSLKKFSSNLIFETNFIYIKKSHVVTSYETAALADLLRTKSFNLGIKFSFETVFSDASKINFIKQLKLKNYKIYLYVVSTLNPEINLKRVENRVKNKGHSVPENKIISRYHKSLLNIKKAIPLSHRCFIIDNSQEYSPVLIAEIFSGEKLNFINRDYQPIWAKQLIKKLK